MYHTGFAKEYPSAPFVRNDNGEEYPLIFQKELTGRDASKFMKLAGLDSLIEGIPNANIDFNVVTQGLTNKKETNISFHTWILKNINKHMYIIPNDKSVDVTANFKYTICSLVPQFNSPTKTAFIDGAAKICNSHGNTLFLPLNLCKFIVNNAKHQFYALVSIIKNGSIKVKESSESYTKELCRIGITLHILIDSSYENVQMSDIVDYIKNVFKINLSE